MNIKSILRRTTKPTNCHVVFTLGILGLCLVSGCSAGEKSSESRREFAIQFNRERLATSKNEVEKKWVKDILSVLSTTSTSAITKPKLASAILAKGKNGTYGLFVFWIESHPSVDSVEFRISSQASPEIIPIPESIVKQNQAAAKDTIVFGSEFDWKATSELWKSLESITSAKDLEVRLVQAKTPVTGWFGVDFYKVDKWIGNARIPDAK